MWQSRCTKTITLSVRSYEAPNYVQDALSMTQAIHDPVFAHFLDVVFEKAANTPLELDQMRACTESFATAT